MASALAACSQGAPAAPADLRVASATAGRVTLQWRDRASDEDSVHVERSLDGETYVELTALPADTVVFSDTTAPVQTTVHYRVRARNAQGASAFAGPIAVVTPAWWAPSFAPASWVLGQLGFYSAKDNFGQPPTENSRVEGSMAVADGKFFMVDSGNNRVLVYDEMPKNSSASATMVVGQPDLRSGGGGQELGQFQSPSYVKVVDGKLYVMDTGNNRLQFWNTIPTVPGQPADGAFGRITSGGYCVPYGLNRPLGFTVAAGRLILADSDNNRVLIWNQVPQGSGAEPDVVLGQAGFTTCASNDDNQDGQFSMQASARTLSRPTDVWSDGTRLAVVDQGNHRVLIWTTFPTQSFTPAELILGQRDPRLNACDDDDQDGGRDLRPSARTLCGPAMIEGDGNQLFVSDAGNHRVLVWSTFPTMSFMPADAVLGQSDFHHRAYNDDDQDGRTDLTPSPRVLYNPGVLFLYRSWLFVHDIMNQRLLAFEARQPE